MQLDIKLLQNLSKERYLELKNSGMFWEHFPQASGIFKEDTKSSNNPLIKGGNLDKVKNLPLN